MNTNSAFKKLYKYSITAKNTKQTKNDEKSKQKMKNYCYVSQRKQLQNTLMLKSSSQLFYIDWEVKGNLMGKGVIPALSGHRGGEGGGEIETQFDREAIKYPTGKAGFVVLTPTVTQVPVKQHGVLASGN